MFFNILFTVIMYPILFIMYYILKSQGLQKSSLYFSVTLPKPLLHDERMTDLSDLYKKRMNRLLLILALIPISTYFISSFSISFTIWMLWTCAACFAFAIPYANIHKKIQQIVDAYLILHPEDTAMQEASVEDHCWIGGMLYRNPAQKKSFCETRFGTGTTVNLATPTGKIFMGIAIISLLVIPAACGFALLEEFTPISLTVSDDTLIAEHINVDYSIPLSEINEISLLTELPSMSKSNGTALDNLDKGNFYSRELRSHFQVFLNPENTLFLQITAADTIYLLSGYDDASTQEIYDIITQNSSQNP